jgi:hypothetical protein
MNSNSDNRKRAFADVVTIDAWHGSFLEGHAKVDLHVDVVFGTARIGGDSQSPVRFRLSAKRAEVVVIIPESEPVLIDRNSVSRDAPELQGHLTEVVEQTNQTRIKGRAAVSTSLPDLAASLATEASAQASRSENRKFEISATVQFLVVTQSKTVEGEYRWLVEPRSKEIIIGRPWDAVKQPRLKLIDQRKDQTKGIPPTVRVEVRCRREDLLIEDLEIKDETLWQAAKRKVGFKNKMAAAESYKREEHPQAL